MKTRFPRLLHYKCLLLLLAISILLHETAFRLSAQTPIIQDAWWTFQQDCDGDGFWAGTLPGNVARLNWNPDVVNCNGSVSVFEILYSKPFSSPTWTAIYTNAPHTIAGCSSNDGQHRDIAFGAVAASRDYKIEIYRTGETVPVDVRSNSNDADLSQHKEELLLEDACESDTFATSAVLGGSVGIQTDNNINASKQSQEPDHAGNSGGKSLWYSWTPSSSTPVTFETTGSGFDTLLAVYTGISVSALTPVASNDDIAGATNRQSRVTFTPNAGTTYRIAVDGFGGSYGLLFLSWNQTGGALPDLIIWGPAASPYVGTRTFAANDCEVLEGTAIVGTRRLLHFTTETRNIGASDLNFGNPATNSLFHFASCHGHYHFEEFASYDLLDGAGNHVAIGNKAGFCLVDHIAWSPTANPQPKFDCDVQGIQSGWADIYGAGLPGQYVDITGLPAGEYVLRIAVNYANLIRESNTNNNVVLIPVSIPQSDCSTIPANDAFASPFVIPYSKNRPFSTSQFNTCATKEVGEPNHAGSPGGHSLWYSWTPTNSHLAQVTTKRSDYNTVLAVYTGNSVTALTLIGSNDDVNGSYNPQSAVTFQANAGTTYRFAVDGFGAAVGATVINVNPPGNDDYDQRYVLSGTSGTTNGSNVGASKHFGELAHASDVGGKSIWYSWTAPVTGPVEFNTLGSSFNTTLAIYTGGHTGFFSMVPVASNNDAVGGLFTSATSFSAVAGTIYQIAVDGAGGDHGNVQLNWNMDSRLTILPVNSGTAQVSMTGVLWQRYTLFSSTNLTVWTTNKEPVTVLGAPHLFTNSMAPNVQFYKAVLIP